MAKFKLAGEEFALLDVDGLTFAEGRAIQKATGVALGKLMQGAADGDTDLTQALLWVTMKRRRPEMKFSDLDDVPMQDIEWVDGEGGDESDPTEGETQNSPNSD